VDGYLAPELQRSDRTPFYPAAAVVTRPGRRPRLSTVQLLESICTMIRSSAITIGEVARPPFIGRWHGPDPVVSDLAELLAAT
jgi:hypothetical protein